MILRESLIIKIIWGFKIKFIDLDTQYQRIKKNVDQDIIAILDDSDFILGEKVFELEEKLAEYVGVNYCITCASGTDALLIPLMANKVGLEDAVFTTNFSFFATTEVISHLGATPVFVDIDPNTYNIDPALLEKKIQEIIDRKILNPKAIIAVDLFGQLADYDKVEKIADVFIHGVPTRSGMYIKEVGMLGISSESEVKSLNIFESMQSGIYATYKVIEEVAYMFLGFITGNIPIKYTAGLIGMANMAGEVAQQTNGFINLIGLMALISTNLGFINILPIPGLDGGHAAIAIVEGIRGKELSQKIKMRIQLIGLGLIIMLFTYTIFNDIRNIGNF